MLFIGLNIIAQTNFEKGYYITINGNKVECYIKNDDWLHSPLYIKYKMNENSKINTISNKQINKLVIPNKFIFERHLVDIEKQDSNLNKLTESRKFNYNKESLFLKVLVDGKARLLKYNDKNVNYFYYQNNKKVLPLKYKVFKSKKNILLKNLDFQQTLKNEFNCSSKKINYKIKYKESSIVKYFQEYNKCINSSFNTFSNETKKGKLNIYGKVSVGIANSDILFSGTYTKYEFNSKLIFKLGLEFEYILPFNNNKWAVFAEPTYQSYSTESKPLSQGAASFLSINYKSIELPIGVRHFLFTKNSNKFYLNAGFNLDNILSGEINFNNSSIQELGTLVNYFLGFGYNYKNKYTIELRVNTPRDLTRLNANNTVNYNDFSLKLGYNFSN